jgi:serine/threonine protein kinase
MEQLLKIEGLNRNYTVEKVLGYGAMGTVYLATDKRLDRLVAIKVLNLSDLDDYMGENISDVVERFNREAKAVAKLSHPNIVSIYDVGSEKDLHYMVIEYLEGIDLSVLRIRKQQLTIEQILNIGIQICKALDFAHKKGIIHRDIKPANIIFTIDNTAKLMDFGFAMQNSESHMRLTQEGSVFGSIMYISAEQLNNSMNVDARSDIYSLGATLYELLAGRPPFGGDNIATLVMNILTGKPLPPSRYNPEIPPLLDKIILKALQKNVNDRYQSAEEMGSDLDNLLHNQSSEQGPVKSEASLPEAEAKEQAEAAGRDKAEFLAKISHEILTPLSGVIGFVDLLMKTKLNETQHQYMSTVFQSANSLLDVVNEKFNISKIEAARLEPDIVKTDIMELCSQVADMLKYQIHKKDLEMLLNLSVVLPRFIWADSTMLRQILVNLLSNSLKFTSRGEIELKVETLAQESEEQYTFRFSVRDTGPGIEPQKREEIFEAFSQEDSASDRKSGLGLGLTISNKLLELMNSNLQLESTPGKGSTFFFDLELKAMPGEVVEWDNETRIRNMLIVDDNANNRLILKDMLQSRQINSETAKNGIEALEKIAAKTYEAILIDYHMPYMDGLKTVRKIREEVNPAPGQQQIILLYNSTDDENLHKACKELGVKQRLVKPVRIQQLFQALDRLNQDQAKEEMADDYYTAGPLTGSKPITVLITEDHHVNMLLTKTIIKEIFPDARIIEANNGKEAVEYFKTEKPDIIFMDVQMPEMNGYEAVTEIRSLEKESRVPIIALTAATVKGEREKCLKAGMDDYLTKPVIKDTIQRALNKWVIMS